MTLPPTAPFDPNFEGLLREAAASPHSMLLRVERPQVFAALRSREAPASVAMAGLSSAERELLASYRAELGFLLRQALVSILLNQANAEGWIDHSINDHERHAPLGNAQLLNRVAEVGDLRPNGADDALLRLMQIKGEARNVPEIAAAALRVDATDQARIYLGAFFATTGDHSNGIHTLSRVLDGNATVPNEVFARECMALALGRIGDYEEALEILLPAMSDMDSRVEVPLRCLFYSVLTANRTRILETSTLVAQHVSSSHERIPDFCRDLAGKIAMGRWRIDRAISLTARDCIETIDPVSARIIHAITE